jgi:hypothetical protein
MRHLGIFSWFDYDLTLEERLELIAFAGFGSTFLWPCPEERLVERAVSRIFRAFSDGQSIR